MMPSFKAATTRAEAHKSKGAWIIPSSKSHLLEPFHRHTKRCRLLQLPGEVRNLIYDYVFEDPVVVQFVPSANDDGFALGKKLGLSREAYYHQTLCKEAAQTSSTMPRIFRFRMSHSRVNHQVKWATSLHALILTCRQIYAEAAPLLYARMTFFFQSARAIVRYLAQLRTPQLAALQKIHIDYRTYGNPQSPGTHECWMRKYEALWRKACELLATKPSGLRQLWITVEVHQFPLRFRLAETWVAPLLEFAKAPQPVDDVKVDIMTPSTAFCDGTASIAAETTLSNLVLYRVTVLFSEVLRRRIVGWDEDSALEALDELRMMADGPREFVFRQYLGLPSPA